MNAFLGTYFLDTDAAMQTVRPVSELTSFADILTHSDILTSPALAAVFTVAPCSVCEAGDLPTVGPTFFDSETGGQFCLGCLELACDPLEDGPEELEDPAIVAYAEEWISARCAA